MFSSHLSEWVLKCRVHLGPWRCPDGLEMGQPSPKEPNGPWFHHTVSVSEQTTPRSPDYAMQPYVKAEGH